MILGCQEGCCSSAAPSSPQPHASRAWRTSNNLPSQGVRTFSGSSCQVVFAFWGEGSSDFQRVSGEFQAFSGVSSGFLASWSGFLVIFCGFLEICLVDTFGLIMTSFLSFLLFSGDFFLVDFFWMFGHSWPLENNVFSWGVLGISIGTKNDNTKNNNNKK